MSWQRRARTSVAVVGLGCAAALYFYARPRTPAPPPDRLAEIDPRASLEGGPGEILHGKGRSEVRMTFSGSRRYDSGRMVFTDVRMLGLEEQGFSLRADTVETQESKGRDLPGHYRLTGTVVFDTDDGLTVETEAADLDQDAGIVTLPGALTFRRGRLSGSGTGAVYQRETETITINQDAVANVAPGEDGTGSARATSTRMALVRGQHSLLLDGNAQVVGDNETLTADRATFLFTEDEKAVKFLELGGRARVTPKAGADRPSMAADKITMSFHSDGLTLEHATLTGSARLQERGSDGMRTIAASWIDLFTAPDGRTLTSLAARDRVVVELPAGPKEPGRRITSTSLTATGDEKRGLTSARFEGEPRFEEIPAGAKSAAREGTAVTLVLALSGALDAIDRAEFNQQAVFKDGDVTGWADRAVYDERGQRLELMANVRAPRRLSRVITEDLTVDADEIDVSTESRDLNATGSVTTRTTRGGQSRAKPGSLFDGTEPIIGSAQQLTYRRESGTAVYVGTPKALARLGQGVSEVAGERIEYSDEGGRLSAAGQVDTTWQLTEDTGKEKGQEKEKGGTSLRTYRVRADTFSYEEERRVAVYDGKPVRLVSDDGDIEGGRLSFTLMRDERRLETMRVEDQGVGVFAVWPGGYEAEGSLLTYRAETGNYVLEGRPARVKAPDTSGPPAGAAAACTLHVSLVIEFNRTAGTFRFPASGQAPQTDTPVPCSMSLRKAK